MIALIAGDTVIWKPSSKAFVSAIAAMKIAWRFLRENNLPDGILMGALIDREAVASMQTALETIRRQGRRPDSLWRRDSFRRMRTLMILQKP